MKPTVLASVAFAVSILVSGTALADKDCVDPVANWQSRDVLRERLEQRGPDRDPDRLAVQRVAASPVEDHRVGPERRGVAEQTAHIVVVANPRADQDDTVCRQPRQQLFDARLCGLLSHARR